MQGSPHLPERPECPACRATYPTGAAFCTNCGARLEETPAEILRAINFLLSELSSWETAGIINTEQAADLRESYEHRRELLKQQLAPVSGAKQSTRPQTEPQPASQPAQQVITPPPLASAVNHGPAAGSSTGPATGRFEDAGDKRTPRRLVETLTDPHNLRLMLYTGAAMIVVSVILWLRDVLYLKLQEPMVQAGLLATATAAFTASGWYAILRTRQRLTGRALTLIGSLLVPINFWFLVRSGLITDNGRAWLVCALCAILYALTALLLREKLYVYLASGATLATGWSIVFRLDRTAFGLYALVSMLISLAFLHLSEIFPRSQDKPLQIEDEASATEEDAASAVNSSSQTGFDRSSQRAGLWSYDLWGVQLVRVGLAAATLSAFFYLPLRLGSSPSLYEGIFRLRASTYDASIAALLLTAWAYALWFTGRFIYTNRRVALYTLALLALCWTELLTLDGFRVEGFAQLLALTATTLALAAAARLTRGDEYPRALHTASMIASLLLVPALFGGLLDGVVYRASQAASFAFLAASFAVLSTPRFCQRVVQVALSYLSAALASIAFLVALGSTSLKTETGFALCAVWPFALYALARGLRSRRSELHLAAPFVRVADAEFLLNLCWSTMVALFLHLAEAGAESWRASMFFVLAAAILYGLLRTRAEASALGAGLGAVAALVLTAAGGDALKHFGLLPKAWPVATLTLCAAFLIQRARALWLPANSASALNTAGLPETVVRLLADMAALLSALLWFLHAIYFMESGGLSAAFVLLLALLYWTERTARLKSAWTTRFAFIHAGAFFISILIALRVEANWFVFSFALLMPPLLFALGVYAQKRGALWLATEAWNASALAAALSFITACFQSAPHLRAGDALLLAPCLTLAAIALEAFIASFISAGPARVSYFRAGLLSAVAAFSLACLRAGFDPLADVEVYTSPVAIALLLIAYLSVQREWEEYERDTGLLLWSGSLLLCVPLLLHSLEFRLVLDVPAPWRDLGVLFASLALALSGVLGRARAPVLVGLTTLVLELLVLALTTVDWLQVPLKVYLITVGSLLALIGWMLEFRREQLIQMRDRFKARRELARRRLGQWR
ncbi:MAG TPA: zinc ribbon domain-containing protein [Pyrinomonadaceae bacterium]